MRGKNYFGVWLVCVGMVICFLVLGVSPVRTEENLLINPGFESDGGWVYNSEMWSLDSSVVEEGKFSMKTSQSTGDISQDIPVEPGGIYLLSVSLKTDTPDSTIILTKAGINDGAKWLSLQQWQEPIKIEQWKTNNYLLAPTVPGGTLQVIFSKPSGEGNLWIDNVRLVKIPVASKDNLISSFESDVDLNKWEIRGQAEKKQSTQYATDGNFSCEVFFPGSKGESYPGIGYSSITVKDWRRYTALACDVYNPQDKTIQLAVRVDNDKKQVSFGYFELKPKEITKVRFPITDLANLIVNHREERDMSCVNSIFLHLTVPKENTVLYLDNIRLLSSLDEKNEE